MEAYKIIKVLQGQTHSISSLKVPASWPTRDNHDSNNIDLENPKNATDWRIVVCPKEIQCLLRLHNQRYFGQAKSDSTPFTVPPLLTELNWSALTGGAEIILEGDHQKEDLDTITQSLLDNCTRVTDLDILESTITEKIPKSKYSCWKECASTSPPVRHLGHWKVLWKSLCSNLEDTEKSTFYTA